jgi:hypothetical protein
VARTARGGADGASSSRDPLASVGRNVSRAIFLLAALPKKNLLGYPLLLMASGAALQLQMETRSKGPCNMAGAMRRGLLEPNAAIAWRALQHFPQNDTPVLRFTFDIYASKFCVPKGIPLSSYSNKLFNGYFFIMYYTIYTID